MIINNSKSYNMSIMERAIGWLAPPLCISCGEEGSSLCLLCERTEITPYGERCWSCGSLSPGYRTCSSCRRSGSPGRVWVVTNYESKAQQLMRTYKFDENRAAADAISRLMAGQVYNQAEGYIVVPVPTATKRVRARGFDHSVLLAGLIARRLKLKDSTTLRRLGQSRQVGSARAARKKQIDQAFWVKNPKLVYGQKILLVDDVVTTGATLNEAAKTLRQAGAVRVDALIFAKKL